MAAAIALMESPAIVLAVLLANRERQRGSAATLAGLTSRRLLQINPGEVRMPLLKESWNQ